MKDLIIYAADNMEWVVPVLIVFVEIIFRRLIPTKDSASIVERIGKIMTVFLDKVRVKNLEKKNKNDSV